MSNSAVDFCPVCSGWCIHVCLLLDSLFRSSPLPVSCKFRFISKLGDSLKSGRCCLFAISLIELSFNLISYVSGTLIVKLVFMVSMISMMKFESEIEVDGVERMNNDVMDHKCQVS